MKATPGSVFPESMESYAKANCSLWRFSYFINGHRIESKCTYYHAGTAKQAMRKLVNDINERDD